MLNTGAHGSLFIFSISIATHTENQHSSHLILSVLFLALDQWHGSCFKPLQIEVTSILCLTFHLDCQLGCNAKG